MSTSRLTKSLYFMKIFRPSKRKILLPFADAYTQSNCEYFVHKTYTQSESKRKTVYRLGAVRHMCSGSYVDFVGGFVIALPWAMARQQREYSSKTLREKNRPHEKCSRELCCYCCCCCCWKRNKSQETRNKKHQIILH